jgi:fluoride exporter
MTVFNLVLVAVGGAIGSICRYLTGILAGRLFGPDFPWGTVIVNIVGSLVMGVFVGLLALRFNGSTSLRLFVAVGFLGGFTTLSSFSLDAVTLWERGAAFAAGGYVIGSVVASIGAVAAGLWIVRALA